MNVADNLLGGKAIEAWQDSPTVGILTYVALRIIVVYVS